MVHGSGNDADGVLEGKHVHGGDMRLTRRSFVLGGLAVLPGCGGAIFGLPGAPAAPFAQDGPSRLRIAGFEAEPADFMFHTGLIIHSPEDRVLYDPGGFWRDPRAVRRHDVTRGMTPTLENAYLNRSSMAIPSAFWTLHLWDAEVPDTVARRAIEIAAERTPYVFGACTYGVSSLLHELSGFEDIRTTFSPSSLAEQLQARNDLRYSTCDLGATPQEA